jgi:site-specific DNA-cytosine methylase
VSAPVAVDLFAGAGGASLGLHQAGYTVVGFDHWQPAVDTHNANGLPAHLHDLSDPERDHLIPECDLLWASPPCQPFSAAGNQDGEFDDRDGFPWLLRIVARLLPPVVCVENVKGLTFATHAAYFGRVLASFTRLGYRWEWKVLNAADYGVPQTRERCFIVARRDQRPIVWPAPTHAKGDSLFLKPWVTMAEALGWSGELSYRRGEGMIEPHGERGPWDTATIPAPTVHRNSEKDWRLQPGSWADGRGGNRRNYHPHDEPAPSVVLGNDASGWRWVLDYRQTGGDGTPVIVDVTDRPAPTVGTQSQSQWIVTREDWPHHRPATTIAGDIRVFQPGGHHQPGEQSQNAIRLTIAELARLQGFPDTWQWTGTKTAQARQIGNAVPPILAQRVAEVNRP